MRREEIRPNRLEGRAFPLAAAAFAQELGRRQRWRRAEDHVGNGRAIAAPRQSVEIPRLREGFERRCTFVRRPAPAATSSLCPFRLITGAQQVPVSAGGIPPSSAERNDRRASGLIDQRISGVSLPRNKSNPSRRAPRRAPHCRRPYSRFKERGTTERRRVMTARSQLGHSRTNAELVKRGVRREFGVRPLFARCGANSGSVPYSLAVTVTGLHPSRETQQLGTGCGVSV
jgi:hypothetical protein